MSLPVVFLGPTLRQQEARGLFAADYRPPVAQGDVMRACAGSPPAIVIIDGLFRGVPTVRHREILWALSCGIPVYGAASMGALRAAELAGQGMIGAGLIYRWYRRFALLPDDAVAVAHGPVELGAPCLSDALVDIRRSLSAARRAGRIGAGEAAALSREAAATAFPDRRLPAVAAPWRVAQKARDARGLLHHLARVAAKDAWPRPETPRPPLVHAWLDDLRDSGVPEPANP